MPPPNPDPIGIADAILVRPTVVMVFDAVLDTLTLVTPVRPAAGVSADAALARAVDRLTAVVEALDKPLAREPALDATAAAAGRAGFEHIAGRIPRDGGAGEGLYRGG